METSHNSLPLNHLHIQKTRAYINRTYALFHILALSAIFYYRGSFFLNKNNPKYQNIPFLPWLSLFVAELIFSSLWLLKQPAYWWPVTRTAFPERLPKDEDLPCIDVFICTADPKSEPTFDVMNTVISAMTLDYPSNKLSVYLSDDGGASVTLKGIKMGWVFATWWLPFCRKYNVKTICPQAYFEKEIEEKSMSQEFIEDRRIINEKYEVFKQRMTSMMNKRDEVDDKTSGRDHPALIQIINGKNVDDVADLNPKEETEMPLLVYVAREKRPSQPHNFKAGALNVLLRVSSTMSNSPYALVLDCDMYCNDSISARQAMCFHLDPRISSSLGWIQYPHKFHNVNEIDIYDSQIRTGWTILYPGADGLQGPVLSGTNFYIKKEALYDIKFDYAGENDIRELKDSFGPSNEFIKSLSQSYKPNVSKGREISSVLLQEAEFLASCTYENDTKWGNKVGFRYESIVEDVMTSFFMQSKGWRSVYLNPQRPQFLGSATTTLNDLLIQGIRWFEGLLSIGLSKHCPLIYRPSKMQLLQRITSAWIGLFPLDDVPLMTFATIIPICFFYGIQLYPEVSDPFLVAFAFVFLISRLKHLYGFRKSGGSTKSWFYEQRSWMIKAVTCYAYGTLYCLMGKFGLREATFIPTNKAGDEDRTKYYQMGKYDFRTSYMFLVPLGTLVILNLGCFVGGITRLIIASNWEAMFAQLIFSLYVVVMSFPIIEGMLIRKDDGRFPSLATLISTVFVFGSLSLLSFLI